LGQQLEIDHRSGPLAQAGADTIAARIAAADHDDTLALCTDGQCDVSPFNNRFWSVRKFMAK
jgi:hypothetical protein